MFFSTNDDHIIIENKGTKVILTKEEGRQLLTYLKLEYAEPYQYLVPSWDPIHIQPPDIC